MLILLVDTAGATGGVLLAHSDGPLPAIEILAESQLEPRESSTQLIPALGKMFKANRMELADLDALAVVVGPGSFTGLRIGLSAVKAMAEVAAKPVIPISRLAMMATAVDIPGVVHVLLDAGRGEFYHGIYRDRGMTCISESLETSASLTTSFESIPGAAVASEPVVVDALRALPGTDLLEIPLVTVRDALPLVFTAWLARTFGEVAVMDANYLRRIEPAVAFKSAPARPQSGL
jgi:tRNA threonylcarbamoyladenosine biosynthesis protein TsaB